MPINYARRLTGGLRTRRADRHLGLALAFIAGAINAGGFLAVAQYTSHMTGIVSALADHVALGAYELLWSGFGALLSFLFGAICSSAMVNFVRQRRISRLYAFPLLLEAVHLLPFGVFGSRLASIERQSVPATVMLLCFIMGLQNAVISKLSKSEIRTTHITGSYAHVFSHKLRGNIATGFHRGKTSQAVDNRTLEESLLQPDLFAGEESRSGRRVDRRLAQDVREWNRDAFTIRSNGPLQLLNCRARRA